MGCLQNGGEFAQIRDVPSYTSGSTFIQGQIMSDMKRTLLILLFLPLLFSCENLLFEKDMASENPNDNFEYLWQQCNEKYSYMDYKRIDWDLIHDQYAARIFSGMSQDSLFTVLGNMMNELKDGHVNLKSHFNVSHYNIQKLGPDNFDFRLIEDHYLPDDYYVSGPFIHDFISNKRVGYIRLDAFTGTVTNANLDFILQRYANTEGIILDIRENGGGASTDVFKIISRFVSAKTHVYDSRLKSGKGHNDFTATEPGFITPAGNRRYLKKIMLLTDRGTFSAGSFTTLAMKELPNVMVVGDTTGGGLGLPNGGQLPNGWIYRFSITQTLDLAGNNYESGVPPDIQVDLKNEDRNKGVDTIVERALEEILK